MHVKSFSNFKMHNLFERLSTSKRCTVYECKIDRTKSGHDAISKINIDVADMIRFRVFDTEPLYRYRQYIKAQLIL